MIDTYLPQVVSCDHGISLPRYLQIIDDYQNIAKVLWVTVALHSQSGVSGATPPHDMERNSLEYAKYRRGSAIL